MERDDEILALKAVSAVDIGDLPIDDESLRRLRRACTRLLRLDESARVRVIQYVLHRAGSGIQ